MDEIGKKAKRMIVAQTFLKMGDADKKTVEAILAYRKRRDETNQQSSNYTPEYTKQLQDQARAELQSKNAKLYEEMKAQFDKLSEAVREGHSGLSPAERTALSETVNIIRNIGPKISSETVQMLNADFANNQPGLRVLRDAYKAAGVIYDGGLDQQIYNVESMLEEIDKSARAAFLENGNRSAFTAKLEKLATYEGFPFKATPDPDGMMEALRAGAGLPETT